MNTARFALLGLSLVAVCAACAEDDHTHDPEDFASRDECVEHYKGEGHDDAEVDDLCKEFADQSA